MDTSKALELIGQSEHVGLLLPQNPGLDLLVSAEITSRALEEQGKQVGLLSSLDPSSVLQHTFPRLSSRSILPREFIVSLDTSSNPISQLRYEKEDGKLHVVFSPKSGPLSQKLVSFKDGKTLCDCVMAFGIENIEEENAFPDPAFLSETSIINVDNSGKNKLYGEANLVDQEKIALSHIAYEFTSKLTQRPLSPDAATLVLGAILKMSDHFRLPGTTSDTFLVASELTRIGADLVRAQELSREEKEKREINLLQLLGRASVRSRLDGVKNVLWSFLTIEDFEKTGRTPQDLGSVIEHMRKEFPSHSISTLLWQNPEENSVRALLAGNKEILEKIRLGGAGTFRSPHLAITASFPTFKEAEEILGSLLEGVL